ncbi:DUF3159 domain-containing protein [Lapillicoccus sp.]|uniref:DUF3159 domain-containing protein n=1 Tax=Lapillicoccus sp. TaxID=1909287 RepID=UPI0027C17A06|nr:DUF3159 domain-containing protein [Actinomycetota bacterium]
MAEAAARPPGVPDGDPSDSGPLTVEELLRTRLSLAIGGWRGALESALPTVGFVVVWTFAQEARPAIYAAAGAIVVLAAIRLLRKETLRFLLYAAVAVAVAAFFALRSGKGEDAFLPGMLQTAAVGLVLAISNLVRWPLFGFLIAAADPELAEASERLRASTRKGAPQDPDSASRAEADQAMVTDALTGWRRHPGVVRVASRVGWVIVALDVVRLAIMVPLYLAGQVAALGVAKIVLGWPAYLLAVAVIGVLLLRGSTPLDDSRPAPA